MFSTVLKEITDYLDRRFVVTVFIPSLLFWGGLVLVYALNANISTFLAIWNGQAAEIKVLLIIAALAWITFSAFVLANQLTWLMRQFEGYWDWLPLGSWLRRLRQGHYVKLLNALDVEGDTGYEKIYYGYPLPVEPEHVMPTRLGNIIKNAELYSFQRYQADAVLLWPRLYSILPKDYIDSLADAKTSLDLMLVISALSGIFGLVAGAYLIITGGMWWWFIACFLGGLLLSRLSYLSALQAAIPYAQLIKSAFDLYRWELLDQLGYDRPKSLSAEIELWDNLCKLIYRNAVERPSALRYGRKEEKK